MAAHVFLRWVPARPGALEHLPLSQALANPLMLLLPVQQTASTGGCLLEQKRHQLLLVILQHRGA